MKTEHKVTRTIPVQEYTANVEVFEIEIPEREVLDTLIELKGKYAGGDKIVIEKEASARALATPNKPGKRLIGLWNWSSEKGSKDINKLLAQLSIGDKRPRHSTFEEAAVFALVEGGQFAAFGEEDGAIYFNCQYDTGGPQNIYFIFSKDGKVKDLPRRSWTACLITFE